MFTLSGYIDKAELKTRDAVKLAHEAIYNFLNENFDYFKNLDFLTAKTKVEIQTKDTDEITSTEPEKEIPKNQDLTTLFEKAQKLRIIDKLKETVQARYDELSKKAIENKVFNNTIYPCMNQWKKTH